MFDGLDYSCSLDEPNLFHDTQRDPRRLYIKSKGSNKDTTWYEDGDKPEEEEKGTETDQQW